MSHFFSQENLEKFCEEHPDSIAFAHLASRLMEKKEYEKAMGICEKGVQKHSTYYFGHYILALLYYYKNNYSDAKREMEIALAYNESIPQAWKILADINERLKLTVMTRESYLKYYLSDCFSKEAAEKYLNSDVGTIIGSEAEVLSEEMEEKIGTEEIEEESSKELSEEEIESLFETSDKEAEEENFEKTLDDVFKETLYDEELTRAETDMLESEKESEEEEEIEKVIEQEEEKIVGEDEFASAMDSFFQEYEKDKPEKEAVGEIPESESDEFEIELDRELEKKELEEEKKEKEEKESFVEKMSEPKEESIEEKVETEEIAPKSEFPEEFIEEEPMDFSAVVADIISERDVSKEETATKEEKSEISVELPKEEIVETVQEDKTVPKVQVEEKKKAAPKVPAEKLEDKKFVVPKPGVGKAEQINRPPILSPTLGEIYIAQGRFNEAIDVFRQLLDKDPENVRYSRKIEDLDAIIKKLKSKLKE